MSSSNSLYNSTKRPGNLASAFVSDYKAGPELSKKFIQLKKQLVPDQAKLTTSWNRLLQEFEKETKLIKDLGSQTVPKIEFRELAENGAKFPEIFEEEVRKRGCVLIKGVVSEQEALKYKEDVKKYIKGHEKEIAGFPEDNPQVWEIYWSKSQISARSHPNFIQVSNAMNKLWSAEKGTPIDLSTSVSYCDRLRIRQPGDTSFTLGEHIDGGSVERWEDPEYRKCYEKILSGNWEDHDSFDATHRVSANMDLYDCSGGCSMFRTFQGWMSLSNVKPGGGTLKVCPLIKMSTAYFIMRPLLQDLIDSGDMAGAIPGAQQDITAKFHPHITECMVSVPEVGPGDCVFWHCDMIHAVEKMCQNETDSSVFYIPATPLCTKNVDYLAKQRHAFINGLTPQDFPLNNCEMNFPDKRAFPEDLTELGKLTMGFTKFEAEDEAAKEAVDYANKILFN